MNDVPGTEVLPREAVPDNIVVPTGPQVRNISNSELTSFLSCKLQYEFAFIQNLAPKDLTRPLERGILGHEFFQRYIEARIEGASHERAMEVANNVYQVGIQNGIDVDRVLETMNLTTRYMNHHKGWPSYRLLGTEQAFKLKVSDEITIPMRYDWMVEEISSGKILVGDFKFTFNFWTPDDHSLNAQLPKYISIMRANGLNVHGGFLEEIRTRQLSKENERDPKKLWRRTHYYPSAQRQRNFIRQHVKGSLELIEHRNLSDEEREVRTTPVLNKHGACKYCNFKSLCNSLLDGKDITYDMQVDFVKNEYALGYNPEKPDIKELI